MKRFLLSTVITAVGLWAVTSLVPAITLNPYGGTGVWYTIASYLLVALVFSLVSAIIGRIVKIIAFPLYLLTFGLIGFFINGALFMLVSWFSTQFANDNLHINGLSEGLYVESFGWAMLGSFILSIFTMIGKVIARGIGLNR